MTDANLKSAFAGEGQAHMHYLIFFKRAEDSGFTNVARSFNAVAHGDMVHASNHFKNIRDKGDAVTVSMAVRSIGRSTG